VDNLPSPKPKREAIAAWLRKINARYPLNAHLLTPTRPNLSGSCENGAKSPGNKPVFVAAANRTHPQHTERGVPGTMSKISGIPEPGDGWLTQPHLRGYNALVQLPHGTFAMADLDVRGDLKLSAEYRYELLLQIPGAAELIGQLSGALWKSPDEFEERLGYDEGNLIFRWRASAMSAGIATLRSTDNLVSISLLVCGRSAEQDHLTLQAFQTHLLRELHDTGVEPSFDLMGLAQRPLAATFNFQQPTHPSAQRVAALADRCFAAAYFRFQGLG
jgi:hypothetical protein